MDLRESTRGERGRLVKNMMLRNGVLSKRQGIRDIGYITDENGSPLSINGMYKYKDGYIIHAGEALVRASSLEPRAAFIEYERLPFRLPNEKSQGFVNNGLLYLICGEDMYAFNGEALKSVYDSDLAYVPTTRGSIMPQDKGGAYKDREQENLLTSKRKNTLVASKDGYARYLLDEEIELSREISIKCTVDASGADNDYQTKIYGFGENKRITHQSVNKAFGIEELEGFFGDRGTTLGYDQVEEISIFFKKPIKASELALYSRDSDGLPRIRLSYLQETVYETTEVTLSRELHLNSSQLGDVIDCITVYGNQRGAILDRIELYGKERYEGLVTLEYKKQRGISESVVPLVSARGTKGEMLELFYDERGTVRIPGSAIVGAGQGGSYVIIQEKLSPLREGEGNIEITYHKKNAEKPVISHGAVCKIDTGKEILALCIDGSSVGFSSYSGDFGYIPKSNLISFGSSEEKINAICQMWDFSIGIYKKSQSYFARLTGEGPEFFGFLDGVGCGSKWGADTVNKDTMFITQGGILGSYGYTSQGQSLRSGAVNSLLAGQEDSAVLKGHKGKLYVILDNCTLVADTGYKSYESSRGDSSQEYEWFILDKIDCALASVIDDKIYFGAANGKILTQDSGFFDTEYKKIMSGDAVYKSSEGIYFNGELFVKSGDELLVNNCFKVVAKTSNEEAALGRLNVDASQLIYDNKARLYEGMEIYLDTENRVKRRINYVDYSEGYLLVDPVFDEGEFSKIMLKCDTECLILKENQGCFTLNDRFSQVSLEDFDVLSSTLVKRKPIKCEYVSAPLDLGSKDVSKRLYGIILDINSECGTVHLGYETGRTLYERSASLAKGLDFENLDFNEISLGKDIYGSVTLKCFERFFDYVIFRACSETTEDFAIRGYSVCYSSNGILKGDR